MCKMEVHPIGRVEEDEGGARIVLDPAYGPALRGLEGYSHILVVWWFDRSGDVASLIEEKPPAKPDRWPSVLFAIASMPRWLSMRIGRAVVCYVYRR